MGKHLWMLLTQMKAPRCWANQVKLTYQLEEQQMSVAKELEKLNQLHKEGVLSEVEFTAAKSKLLGSLGSENTVGSGVHLMGTQMKKRLRLLKVVRSFGGFVSCNSIVTTLLQRRTKVLVSVDAPNDMTCLKA